MNTKVFFRFFVSLSGVLTASASDVVFPGGGTLAQIVDGGGTSTIITLMNLDPVAASYTLNFYGDDGNPLSFTTTAGTGTSLSGNLNVGGSIIIKTNGGAANIQQGYGVLVTTNSIAGSAVFGLPLNGVFAEASCPLDTGADYIIALPFDQTAGFTGIALANSNGDSALQTNGAGTATITLTIYDPSGNLSFSPPPFQMAAGAHTSFMLGNQYPQTAGTKGTAVFIARDSAGNPFVLKTLGLRANASGTTLTSITPVIPCNFSGTSCSN